MMANFFMDDPKSQFLKPDPKLLMEMLVGKISIRKDTVIVAKGSSKDY
jgi:hypothetical protein